MKAIPSLGVRSPWLKLFSKNIDGPLAMFPQRRQNRIIAPLDIQQDQVQKLSLRTKICYFLKVVVFFVALIGFCIGLVFVYHNTTEQEGN